MTRIMASDCLLLSLLYVNLDVATAEEIVRAAKGKISTGTAYKRLNALVDNKLVKKMSDKSYAFTFKITAKGIRARESFAEYTGLSTAL